MDRIPPSHYRPGSFDLVVALLAFFGASDAYAQSVIGRVVDASSGAPIPTAEVALMEAGGRPVALGVTDSTGWFRLRLAEAGVYQLAASGPGYEELTSDSVQVDPGEELVLELRLGPRPYEVEGIEVVTRRMVPGPIRDFYWRAEQHKRTGRGIILDRVALRGFAGLSSSQVIRRQPFIRESRRGGPPAIVIRDVRPNLFGAGWCEPAYFLDGLPVDAPGILSIPVSDLEGIEVYRGNQIFFAPPAGGGPKTGCGVIMAWTRRG